MEREAQVRSVAFRHSIAATLASAQGLLVVVLIALSLVATQQFGHVAALVDVTSDEADALMRINHALDLQPDTLRAFQAGYGEANDANARAKLTALAEDMSKHVSRAAGLVATQAERASLDSIVPALEQFRKQLAGLDSLEPDAREVASIELEEAIGDVFLQLDKSKLLTRTGLESRLGSVKLEVRRPIKLFWGAAALGGAIALAVAWLLRRRVSRPIVALSGAVSELARGRAQRIEATGRDEIGVLANAFNDMAATITERTRSLKLVFDSVGEGLITCDREGKVVSEPSARALEWFGTPVAGTAVADYLGAGDASFGTSFGMAFDQLVADMLPFELCADQMPAEVLRNGRTFELKFRQVFEDGVFRRVLVVARDVTEQRAMARKEKEARDVYALSSFALRDPGGYADFKKEVSERLARAARGEYVMLELHTVKGSVGVIGCELFADAVHECESHVTEHGEDTAPIGELISQFQSLCATAEKAVGSGDDELVVVRLHEYHQLLSLLQVTEARLIERARQLARSWSMHRIGSSFERLAKTGVRSAERQGKAVCVQLHGDQICVPKGQLDELWSSLSHLVRNSVAHGIEPMGERTERGKPAEGRIELRADVDHSTLRISVSDDGRGIDWKALARKASGSPPANDNRVELLFQSGTSTAESVTELSGRGVGMSAVHRTVMQLGGSIDVQSELGSGTTIEIRVPLGGEVYVPSYGQSLVPAYHSKAPPRPAAAAAR